MKKIVLFAIVATICTFVSCKKELSSSPSLNLLSPNGGEIFHWGQQITIKWTSHDYPASSGINIIIAYYEPGLPHDFMAQSIWLTTNTGECTFVLPQTAPPGGYKDGKHYKIFLTNGGSPRLATSLPTVSDSLFTIVQ
jgi:hypothetical protein